MTEFTNPTPVARARVRDLGELEVRAQLLASRTAETSYLRVVPEREANLALPPGAESIALDDTGHCAVPHQPARVAELLLANVGA
jgi:hypothetical protein